MELVALRGIFILGVEYCLFGHGLPEPPADKRNAPHFFYADSLTEMAAGQHEIREQSRPAVLRVSRGILVLRTEAPPGYRTYAGGCFLLYITEFFSLNSPNLSL